MKIKYLDQITEYTAKRIIKHEQCKKHLEQNYRYCFNKKAKPYYYIRNNYVYTCTLCTFHRNRTYINDLEEIPLQDIIYLKIKFGL